LPMCLSEVVPSKRQKENVLVCDRYCDTRESIFLNPLAGTQTLNPCPHPQVDETKFMVWVPLWPPTVKEKPSKEQVR
jgi:hypothetical protein